MPNFQFPVWKDWKKDQRPKRLTEDDYIVYPRTFNSHNFHKYSPPTATPYYQYTTPAAQKAMMEVDFTPIFLALLPLFLTLGTLLGLQLQGTSSSTTPDITVNVNATANSSGGTSSDSSSGIH